MQTVTTIGLDIAKSVFQVHGIDAEGKVVIRRQLKRRYVLAFFQKLAPCLVGIEACASSHHWSRELKGLGHTVRLMPPAYVKPFSNRPVGVKQLSETIHQCNVDVARGPALLSEASLENSTSVAWNQYVSQMFSLRLSASKRAVIPRRAQDAALIVYRLRHCNLLRRGSDH